MTLLYTHGTWYIYKLLKYICNNTVADAAEIIELIGGETEYIEEENNVTFRCVGVGYPPPLVQWRKLNGSLSDRVSINNMSMSTNEGNVTNVTVDLIFTGAYREDTGVYECSVSNLLNDVTGKILLIVQCTNMYSSCLYNKSNCEATTYMCENQPCLHLVAIRETLV